MGYEKYDHVNNLKWVINDKISWLKPYLCVVSSWVMKWVWIILIWNTISISSNFDNCFISIKSLY